MTEPASKITGIIPEAGSAPEAGSSRSRVEFIADFHIHSKYSRATSPNMNISTLAKWTKLKGISVLGSGDFTHPMWLLELKNKLAPLGNRLYEHEGAQFILTAEVSTIFYVNGRAHQIHNMIFAPSLEAVEGINKKLEGYGNLLSDGRPMLHIEAEKFTKLVLEASADCMVVPAHVWTPYFSVFGSASGFDRIEDCYKSQTKNIFALETGLSSNPEMNWRLSALDRFSLISNSDAHSPQKLGREANVFDCKVDYYDIVDALRKKDKKRFLYTIEFFPEEGKYHYDGHRKCEARLSPKETKGLKGMCPKCGKPVVVGVANRVDKLADRDEGAKPEGAIPFKSLIPLQEIIAEAKGKAVRTKSVEEEYSALIQRHGGEFNILLKMPKDEIMKSLPAKIADGILRVREGNVNIKAGYDGEYGVVSIFGEEEGAKKEKAQMELF